MPEQEWGSAGSDYDQFMKWLDEAHKKQKGPDMARLNFDIEDEDTDCTVNINVRNPGGTYVYLKTTSHERIVETHEVGISLSVLIKIIFRVLVEGFYPSE